MKLAVLLVANEVDVASVAVVDVANVVNGGM